MNQIWILSVGSGGAEDLTRACEARLRAVSLRVMRTARHPLAAWLHQEGLSFRSLDDLYDSCEDFDTFNQSAADELLHLAETEEVCYCVSDAAFDTTVSCLLKTAADKTEIHVLSGVSTASRMLGMLPENPSGVRVCTAEDTDKMRLNPTDSLLITELHSQVRAGEIKLSLMRLRPEEMTVFFFRGDEDTGKLHMSDIPLFELDRQKEYNHLAAVYVPGVPFTERTRFDMDDLNTVVRRLRAPDGCPWDKAQTYESLLDHLLEESHEYIQAVHEGDIDHMYDELGDVLLQVALHSEIARQRGEFDFLDVTSAICAKMIERHTWLFGQEKVTNAEEALDVWEANKRKKRNITSTREAMERISTALPGLMRASKVLKAGSGEYPLPDQAALMEMIGQTLASLPEQADKENVLGSLLLQLVALCRTCEVAPEIALDRRVNGYIEGKIFEKS